MRLGDELHTLESALNLVCPLDSRSGIVVLVSPEYYLAMLEQLNEKKMDGNYIVEEGDTPRLGIEKHLTIELGITGNKGIFQGGRHFLILKKLIYDEAEERSEVREIPGGGLPGDCKEARG